MTEKTTKILKRTLVALAVLVILPTFALADLEVAGTSSGTFASTGTSTWKELSFTGSSFDSSSSTLLNLGTLSLVSATGVDWLVGQDAFQLLLTFSQPGGVSADATTPVFTADLFGVVTRNVGFVSLFFDTWSEVFSYQNSSGTGTFTLSLYPTDIVLGTDVVTVYEGSTVNLTAKITDVTFTSAPEPGTVASLLVMLSGLGIWSWRFRKSVV